MPQAPLPRMRKRAARKAFRSSVVPNLFRGRLRSFKLLGWLKREAGCSHVFHIHEKGLSYVKISSLNSTPSTAFFLDNPKPDKPEPNGLARSCIPRIPIGGLASLRDPKNARPIQIHGNRDSSSSTPALDSQAAKTLTFAVASCVIIPT